MVESGEATIGEAVELVMTYRKECWRYTRQMHEIVNGERLTPGTVALRLRDGQRLCQNYQLGKCRVEARKCEQGQHRCARVTRNGKVCSLGGHGANQCCQEPEADGVRWQPYYSVLAGEELEAIHEANHGDPIKAETILGEKGNKEAIFKGLMDEFKLDKKVLMLFQLSPMNDLEDFRFYFAEEKEIDQFVAEDATIVGKEFKIQVARVRKAWTAVRQAAARKEARASTSTMRSSEVPASSL